jgi:alkanesulfonate monooxygenase SsuD/methylene tetrahydromethanopterin reductase-like flavin-dependent oxidoreductase (luciferase family)
MDIGIGIPNTIPAAGGDLLLDWARSADRLGFFSLATIGRVAYPSSEELVVLAAAAGATERIGLFTNVLLGPTRDPVLLAKQAATLDRLSGGRFVLGLGVGRRPDDYAASGMRFEDRGRRWDAALELMHRAWGGEPVAGSPRPVTPAPTNGQGVPLIFGGGADAVVRRTVRWGAGWAAGGGGVAVAQPMFERVREAWSAAERPGRPRLGGTSYFALGPDAERGREALVDYYGDMGARMWPGVPKDPAALRDLLAAFAAIGADQVMLMPSVASLDQVERLADAVL